MKTAFTRPEAAFQHSRSRNRAAVLSLATSTIPHPRFGGFETVLLNLRKAHVKAFRPIIFGAFSIRGLWIMHVGYDFTFVKVLKLNSCMTL